MKNVKFPKGTAMTVPKKHLEELLEMSAGDLYAAERIRFEINLAISYIDDCRKKRLLEGSKKDAEMMAERYSVLAEKLGEVLDELEPEEPQSAE